jgi:hypothetical protein
MMRHTKASTTTDVYMHSLEPEVRSPINSIYAELMGDGTHGPPSQVPTPAKTPSLPEKGNLVAAVVGTDSGQRQSPLSERAEAMQEKPARGVVMEFATRMRQSRGREALLND